ncbi:MAG: FAD binding domain-containing protein [Clostridia bacterium]|nr:FAD binding domain-containing protein [Clostridia bacterium]
MKIREYRRPETMEEAYGILNDGGENAVIGGGAWIRMLPRELDAAVDISGLGLGTIKKEDGRYEIGSMVTLRQVEMFKPFSELFNGIISKSAGAIMGVSIRNIATAGGSVAGRFGFSDLIPALLALDTSLFFHARGGISLEDYMESKDVGKDILTKITIKDHEGRGWFHTMKNTSLDFAVLNAAVSNSDGRCRIIVGARPYKAVPAYDAMKFMDECGGKTPAAIREAASIAAGELKFGGNQRGSREYRIELCKTLVERGLSEVFL